MINTKPHSKQELTFRVPTPDHFQVTMYQNLNKLKTQNLI